MRSLCHTLLYCCISSAAWGNPYLQQVERAQPVDEELQQAREQIADPLPSVLDEPLFVTPFHKRPTAESAGSTLCQSCHTDPPHRNSARKRAFLNMHSRFIACETCHWQPEEIALVYRWDTLPKPLSENGIIAPWSDGQSVVATEDHPEVRRLTQIWKQSDDAGKARLKARLHHPLKSQGADCGRCHGDPEPLLDLKALHYPQRRIRELRLNPIARFLDRTEPETPEQPVKRIQLRDLLQ